MPPSVHSCQIQRMNGARALALPWRRPTPAHGSAESDRRREMRLSGPFPLALQPIAPAIHPSPYLGGRPSPTQAPLKTACKPMSARSRMNFFRPKPRARGVASAPRSHRCQIRRASDPPPRPRRVRIPRGIPGRGLAGYAPLTGATPPWSTRKESCPLSVAGIEPAPCSPRHWSSGRLKLDQFHFNRSIHSSQSCMLPDLSKQKDSEA